MKKILLILICCFTVNCYADDLTDIESIIKILIAINGDTSNIKELDEDIKKALTGHFKWGTFEVKNDQQSYGSNAQDWSSVLRLSQQGGGNGALAQTIKPLAKEFPINTALINKSISDPVTQKYYALQAQTVLAARAASQLDYNKIQEQITQQQLLRDQIENTDNIKSAMDLANRIQVESNLIQLETLRQIALSNQQQAVNTQGELNDAVLNAHFLSKPNEPTTSDQEKSNED